MGYVHHCDYAVLTERTECVAVFEQDIGIRKKVAFNGLTYKCNIGNKYRSVRDRLQYGLENRRRARNILGISVQYQLAALRLIELDVLRYAVNCRLERLLDEVTPRTVRLP